jgi:hypothetical protein
MSTNTAREFCIDCGKMFNRDCGHVCKHPGRRMGVDRLHSTQPMEFVTVEVTGLDQLRETNRAMKEQLDIATDLGEKRFQENTRLREKLTRMEHERKRREASWVELEDALLADWDDECDGLITEIGELHEKINAQGYVIGALKTQVADAQQAGMQLQIERGQLFEIARVFSEGMDEAWEQTDICKAALEDWKVFVARWHQQHPLTGARAALAAYVGAGKVTEGLDSNIPY